MGRHVAEKAPPNDVLMSVVVGTLILLLVAICLLAT